GGVLYGLDALEVGGDVELEEVIDTVMKDDKGLVINFKPPVEDPSLASSLYNRKVNWTVREFYMNMKRTSDGVLIRPTLLSAMRSNLPHLTDCTHVDNCVALGYLEINAGHYDRALEILDFVIKHEPNAVSAWIGRGSVFAMQRKLIEAISDFSLAIKQMPSIAEAWKRRGQTYAASGNIVNALSDLQQALMLFPEDADVYYQRGMIYFQIHNYRKVKQDLRKALDCGVTPAAYLFYMLGQACMNLGDYMDSIQAFEEAIRIDNKHRDAYCNIGSAYRELGDGVKAIDYFVKSINVDKKKDYFVGVLNRAHTLYSMGYIAKGLEHNKKAVNILLGLRSSLTAKPPPPPHRFLQSAPELPSIYNLHFVTTELVNGFYRAAISYQALGVFNKALVFYDQILSINNTHPALYQREIMLFYWEYLDTPLFTYNMDSVLPAFYKDAWCKSTPYSEFTRQYKEELDVYEPRRKSTVPVCKPETDYFEYHVYMSVIYHLEQDSIQNNKTKYDLVYPPNIILQLDDITRYHHHTLIAFAHIPNLLSLEQAIQAVSFMSSSAQLSCQGFLSNRRSQRMFSLAVLNMYVCLSKHVDLLCMETCGLMVSDAASSRGGVGKDMVKTSTHT
ncbi:tetratricopeptide repeat protein, partial [archaeon]